MLEKKIHSQAECARLHTSAMLTSIYREQGIHGYVFMYFKSCEINLMSFYCISLQINESVVRQSFIKIFCMQDGGCDCLSDHCLKYTTNFRGMSICNREYCAVSVCLLALYHGHCGLLLEVLCSLVHIKQQSNFVLSLIQWDENLSFLWIYTCSAWHVL
jgi:hypothetical protein